MKFVAVPEDVLTWAKSLANDAAYSDFYTDASEYEETVEDHIEHAHKVYKVLKAIEEENS